MSVTSGILPSQIVNSDQNYDRNNKLLQNAIKQENDRINKETTVLEKVIYDISNPSPIIITLCVLGVLLIVYIINILFIKPNLSGIWVDYSGNLWKLNYSKLTGKFQVFINGACYGSGMVIENYVHYGDLIGVWNYENNIYFMNGEKLQKIIE